MRDKIFISHANPEDNEFTRWLSLQLIKEGFPVWSDLIKLKGGEDFWKDIQSAIRERTIKFLYVLSKVSNEKDGPLSELATARSLKRSENLNDFIIPLAIDDLRHKDYNIELHRLNSISFTDGWAKGINTLLEKLDKDGVKRSAGLGPSDVGSWWREQFSADHGVMRQEEELLSSWFPIGERPREVFFHLSWEPPPHLKQAPAAPNYPRVNYQNGFVSFAPREDFENVLVDGLVVGDTHKFLITDLFEGKHERVFMDAKQARNVVVNLLDQAWRREMERRGLHSHELANKNWCYFFAKGQLSNDKVFFTGVNGERNRRSLIGFRRFKKPDGGERTRFWHFAISAKALLFPSLTFSLKTHVMFSDDGEHIWESDSRLHRARMSQCKNWWNDDWRDRMLAVMSWLAEGEEYVTVTPGSGSTIKVAASPSKEISPVSYKPPTKSEHVAQSLNEEADDKTEVEEEEFFDDEEE